MSLGRQMLLRKNSTTLVGLRNVTLSWGGESVDLTSGEDAGVRVLDALNGQEQIDISAEFILKDMTMLDIALNPATSKMLTDIDLEWPIIESGNATEATLSGNFKLTSFEQANPYNDAITGSLSLESSGDWTFSAETT